MIKNKNALRTLAIDDANLEDLTQRNTKNILDVQFWNDLSDLSNILSPIQKFIAKLEGNDINIFADTVEAFYEISKSFDELISDSFLKNQI